MKKIFTICCCIMMATMSLFAQDIIITKDAKKIEAKILEVSKKEIKYKELNNIEGPTFVLETKEISSVIYENGKVVLYNQDVEADSTKQVKEEEASTLPSETNIEEPNDDDAEIYFLSGQMVKGKLLETADDHVAFLYNAKYFTMPATKIEKVKDLRNGEETFYHGKALNTPTPVLETVQHSISETVQHPVSETVQYVTRTGNSYYYKGRKMRGENYEYFLSENCTEAYNQYKSGHNVAIAGWVLLGVGLGMDVVFSWWAPYTWIPALALEIASIPTLSVGYVRMHRSADTFNASCTKRTTSYWSINASKNGVGIAYNF